MLSLCTCVLQEICCLECLPCPMFCLDGAWLNLTTLLPLPLPPQTPLHHGFCGKGQPVSQNQSQVNCSCIPRSCWQSQVAATWAASSPCSSTATTRASFLVSQAFCFSSVARRALNSGFSCTTKLDKSDQLYCDSCKTKMWEFWPWKVLPVPCLPLQCNLALDSGPLLGTLQACGPARGVEGSAPQHTHTHTHTQGTMWPWTASPSGSSATQLATMWTWTQVQSSV